MKAIVVFDLGSSSLRCTLYDDHSLKVLSHASKDRRTVNIDGSIATNGLLDEIDELLDRVLRSNRDCEVIAVGFSSFAMNLVGVDSSGKLVPGATMSYASQSSVGREDLAELRR